MAWPPTYLSVSQGVQRIKWTLYKLITLSLYKLWMHVLFPRRWFRINLGSFFLPAVVVAWLWGWVFVFPEQLDSYILHWIIIPSRNGCVRRLLFLRGIQESIIIRIFSSKHQMCSLWMLLLCRLVSSHFPISAHTLGNPFPPHICLRKWL